MKAFLKNYRQSPRKVRLVAELIKSKRVAEAILILDTLPKRASLPVMKLLASAISNAKQAGIKEDDLFVENVTVNKGIVLKRSMPRARGSASRINKRTSHVMLTLIEKVLAKKATSAKVTAGRGKKTKPVKKLESKD
ncbi:MAG: 50S ribosomal protein L22 [Candidatus Paceibacterota bacterium]|jgi:large subunit ribosomal protein L22